MSEEIDQNGAIMPESPGAMLSRLRAARDLSLVDVAQRLKYGQRQIEALERDDFSKLPGMTFVRGMIRGYARLLGTDPEIILRELDRRNFPDPAVVDLRVSRIPFPDGKKRTTRVYAALSATLILIAILIGYEVSPWQFEANTDVQNTMQMPAKLIEPTEGAIAIMPASAVSTASSSVNTTAAPHQVAPLDAAALAPTAIPTPTAVSGNSSGSKKIALQFDRESWVEIKQANGKTLLSQLNPGGSRQVVEGIPPFIVTIGNAPNVHLTYNDQPVDLRPHFKVDVARLILE